MGEPSTDKNEEWKGARTFCMCGSIAGLELWGELRVIRNFSNAKVRFEIVGQMKWFSRPRTAMNVNKTDLPAVKLPACLPFSC